MIQIIAYFTMSLDHIGRLFFPNIVLFSLLGRLAFPLFAYGIAIGYTKTSNFRLYCFRLFILGVVSQIPYFMLFENYSLNICFTLLAGLLILRILDINWQYYYKIMAIFLICTVVVLFGFEYGLYGVSTIIMFAKIKSLKKNVLVQAMLILTSVVIYDYSSIQFAALFSMIIILVYNNNIPFLNRYVQYCFYPAHILVLLFLKKIL
ncbi:TraX family protein [Paenibacillus elgii]